MSKLQIFRRAHTGKSRARTNGPLFKIGSEFDFKGRETKTDGYPKWAPTNHPPPIRASGGYVSESREIDKPGKYKRVYLEV